MEGISAAEYQEQMLDLYRSTGILEVIRVLDIPDDWPLTPEEIEEAVAGHDIGSENCIDAVSTAQVAKITRVLGLSPQDSRLVALRAVFRMKLAVDR